MMINYGLLCLSWVCNGSRMGYASYTISPSNPCFTGSVLVGERATYFVLFWDLYGVNRTNIFVDRQLRSNRNRDTFRHVI